MPLQPIGTSAVLIAGNNPNRFSITFRNDSSNDIYLGANGSGVSSTQYDYHLKAGDSVNFNLIEDGDLALRSWYAIASGTSSNLSYLEGQKPG